MEDNMDRLVLLDSNSLINRAFYALPPMTTHDGTNTNAIYGYMSMLNRIIADLKPTHIVATFDVHAPTFRKQMYDEYKAGRKPMPEELREQMPLLKELLQSMNIKVLEMAGYEADDLIGTLAKSSLDTYIVTGDKDSLQLVSDTTTVWLTRRGVSDVIEYTPERLLEDGLKPSQVIDLKALMGDKSDNIPGVPGVGEKTAKDLLAKYDNVEGIYSHIDEIKGKLKEKLENNKAMCKLSYDLATINTNVPIELSRDECMLVNPYNANSKKMLESLRFKTMVERLEFRDEGGEVVENKSNDTFDVIEIDSSDNMRKIMLEAPNIAINIGNTIEFATTNTNYVVKIQEGFLDNGVSMVDVLGIFKEIFENKNIKKVVYDLKAIMRYFHDNNVDIMPQNTDDIMLKAYLIDPNINYKDVTKLLERYDQDGDSIAISIARADKIVDSDMTKSLYSLYSDIELPLLYVLYDMEMSGFRVDGAMLQELKKDFKARIDELSDSIKTMAGRDFNINSPKQLGEVLFVDMGLKGGKKTKTGYSTNVEALSSIMFEHPIIPMILKYRDVQKILSTYIEGMEPCINSDGKIRTTFKQAVTATGRLSSTEPNLQNLPIRKSEGRIIRKMFVASEECTLVTADYSQIELRLMAHLSGDETLIKAYNDGVDIHALTASKVYGVDVSEVTSDMRRDAKAVNFGIIYGISDFGLAGDLGVPVYKAKEFINKYFETYPKVKEYIDNIVESAKRDGMVTTMYGRVRQIPELKSSNYNMRMFGERVAMNTPLQGSASDIIKLAMLKVARELEKGGYKAKLIMQVHDELIVDTPLGEVDRVKVLLKDAMESVADLKVKLVADVAVGDNWLEAKD